MSLKEKTKNKSASDRSSSYICVDDEDSPNTSGGIGFWKRSSPGNSENPSANKFTNISPTFIKTPSPILSPSPERPVSRLKRIIRAPSQPNSPKRLNTEINLAIGKLRPINKYKFEKPTGNSPNTKFSASSTQFSACGTSTPRRSLQVRMPKPKSKSNSTQPANNIIILENIVLKKATNTTIKEQQNAELPLKDLQGQHHSLQTPLSRADEKLHHNQAKPITLTPPLPQTQQQLHHSITATNSHGNEAPHTPPSTPSPMNNSQNPLLTPPLKTAVLPPPTISQQQKLFEHQLKMHIANSKISNIETESPITHQSAFISWATQIEKQQQKIEQFSSAPKSPSVNQAAESNTIQSQTSSLPHKTTDTAFNILPKQLSNKSYPKIPSVFIPHVASIERLTDMIDKDPTPISYTTTAIREGGVRVKCFDIDSYNNLLQLLQKQNILLHTHQKQEDKGLRIVIRNLHATTSSNTIRALLSAKGFEVKYVNVLKNRFTGIPLNVFEVEIDSKNNSRAEQILSITRLGSQEVTIERQAKRTDPVQCHRCQAFGHSKNYCRRAFICMKCAGPHPSTECKKDKNSPGLCANCGNQHVASYKGCPVFKSERAKLLAIKLSAPQAIENNIPPPTLDHMQPSSQSQTYKSTQKDPPLPSKQPMHATNTMTNSQQNNNSSPNPHNLTNNTPMLAQKLISNSNTQKTYSQVAHEATINNNHKLPLHRHTPAPSKLPRPTQTSRIHSQYKPQQFKQQIIVQQLQKSLPTKHLQTIANEPLGQKHNDNQQIIDNKTAIANNELAIAKLNEKFDKLLNLINKLLKQKTAQNTAIENK